MKIFKNRGDIYISKAGYKSSKEERILVTLLIIIVFFTMAFAVVLANKYDSVKDFFAGDSVTVTQNVQDLEVLPEISGKTNYLILETDKDETTIHYIYLLQADKDYLCYKVCTLLPDMVIDNESLYDIYQQGGGAALQTRLTSYFGFDIDYYACFDDDSFIEFAGKLGKFVYPSTEKIKFNGGGEDDEYAIRIFEGEQTVDSTTLSNLLRYYSTEKVNLQKTNEIILYGITQLFNEENYEDREALFRLFISSATTNITVRNMQDGRDSLYVFCKKNTDITVYSAKSEYDDKKVLTQNSVKDIKGYFSK
ncbi:MAG: hypothetical protein ACI4IL_01145 [Eubacterium sp.]